MRHIVLVANTAWSLFNFRLNLILSLKENGFSVSTIAPKDEYSAELSKIGCNVIDLKLHAKSINPIDDIKLIIDLLNTYRLIKPDFIIHYTIKPNIYGSIAARLAGIKSIAITTGLGYTFVRNNLVSKIAHGLYKFSFRFPNEVWFLNEEDRLTFISHKIVSKEKAILLHSEGINIDRFSPKYLPIEDNRFRFLLIARMLWDKGIGEYIKTARKLRQEFPHVAFQLLGACDVENPSAINRDQILSWENEGIIEYLGTTQDVRPAIAHADCVVLPSFYREGIPRTLMEAAAMEKPLITTDNVGCRDVVRDGQTGFICPVRDIDALADCCRRMLNLTQQERQKMGQAGREFMKEVFDEKKIVAQYMATLEKYGIAPQITD